MSYLRSRSLLRRHSVTEVAMTHVRDATPKPSWSDLFRDAYEGAAKAMEQEATALLLGGLRSTRSSWPGAPHGAGRINHQRR